MSSSPQIFRSAPEARLSQSRPPGPSVAVSFHERYRFVTRAREWFATSARVWTISAAVAGSQLSPSEGDEGVACQEEAVPTGLVDAGDARRLAQAGGRAGG